MKRILVFLVMLVAMNVNAQWQPDVRLTHSYGYPSTTFNDGWSIASSGSVVHTVWRDYRDGNWEVYYKRSTDEGLNWETDVRLTNNTSNSYYPSVIVSGSVVHIVWYDNSGIYYKRSTDAGINWGTNMRISNNTSISYYPSIAASGSIVHVVWFDTRDGNAEIYYNRSTDGGVSWGTDNRLTNAPSESYYPSVAVSGSVVHVLWQDNRDGNAAEEYYKRSTDAGVSWGADTRLTNNPAQSSYPSVVVSGSFVHVVWDDWRDGDGNREIYYKRSTDAGVNWGTDTRLTNFTDYSYAPSVAVSGSILHVVWQDRRDGNYEIYYKRSTDAGINWGADIRLTNNIAYSFVPSVAVSGSVVHIVWYDERDGTNGEIYYKRDPTGNLVGINNISTETPSKYSLSQNYPNPFNPTTKIKFSIVSSPHGLGGDLVQLKVYDIQGREVQTLVNESLKPGTYEAAFNIESATEHRRTFGTGVYFYKLISNGFSETKKMILIK